MAAEAPAGGAADASGAAAQRSFSGPSTREQDSMGKCARMQVWGKIVL